MFHLWPRDVLISQCGILFKLSDRNVSVELWRTLVRHVFGRDLLRRHRGYCIIGVYKLRGALLLACRGRLLQFVMPSWNIPTGTGMHWVLRGAVLAYFRCSRCCELHSMRFWVILDFSERRLHELLGRDLPRKHRISQLQ